MNFVYLADGAESFDYLSPRFIFLGNPLCWIGSLGMVGCFVGCLVWAMRLRRKGRPSPCFPGPSLLALVPIAAGVWTGLWYLSHYVQAYIWARSAGIETSGGDVMIVSIAAVAELMLGMGAFFSALAVGLLILIHRNAGSSAAT